MRQLPLLGKLQGRLRLQEGPAGPCHAPMDSNPLGWPAYCFVEIEIENPGSLAARLSRIALLALSYTGAISKAASFLLLWLGMLCFRPGRDQLRVEPASSESIELGPGRASPSMLPC